MLCQYLLKVESNLRKQFLGGEMLCDLAGALRRRSQHMNRFDLKAAVFIVQKRGSDGLGRVRIQHRQGVQSLVLFDTANHKITQVIPYHAPEALFLGVVVAPDGTRVYASAGGNNKIRVYDLASGTLTERTPIVLGDPKARMFPAGLAISGDGRTLYVALNLENEVAVIDTASGARRPDVKLRRDRADETGPLPYALVLAGKKLYVS